MCATLPVAEVQGARRGKRSIWSACPGLSSGGRSSCRWPAQQRVALARASVTRPKVLLLDEPLSALDKHLRQEMQVELRRIQRQIGITTIFVTW